MRAAAVQHLPEACVVDQNDQDDLERPQIYTQRASSSLQAYKDQTLRLEVVRGAEAIGAANGVVSGGPVAFEVNHPGALCWGAGIPAGDPLKAITPNIITGDKARH